MKKPYALLIPLFLLVTATLACNLPTRVAEQAETNGDNFPLPAADQTPIPGEGPLAEEPLDEDLVNAALTLQDLPAGFTALSEAQMAEYGISANLLAGNFTGVLSEAQPQNYTAFLKTDMFNTQIVVSTVLAPLTRVERIGFDVYLANPEQVANEFAEGADAQAVELISGAEGIGDSSVGLTFLQASSGIPMRSDAVIVRRDQTVQVALISYPDGGTPEISAVDVARMMDQKIEGALR